MKNFVNNLAALIKVKTIVTFVVILVFAVLSLRGDITPDNVMNVVIAVIAFYFGTQHEKTSGDAEHISAHSVCPFMVESTEGIDITESTESIESTEKDGE